MVPPADRDHMTTIRARSVRVNLARADYSEELRRFVQQLMEMSLYELLTHLEVEAGWRRGSARGQLVTNCTSALYANALGRYEQFRHSAGGEDRRLVTIYEAARREQDEDAWRARRYQQADARLQQIVDLQDKLFGDQPTDHLGNPKSTAGGGAQTV